MMTMMIAKHRREKKERKKDFKIFFVDFCLTPVLFFVFLGFCSRYYNNTFTRRRATVFISTDDDVSS